MARRRKIDAQTGDYVAEAGGFAKDPTEASNVVRLLRTPRGSVPVAPEMGNRFARIERLTSDAPRAVAQEALRAVDPLIESGQIWDVEIEAVAEGSAMSVVVEFTDANGPQSVRHTARGG